MQPELCEEPWKPNWAHYTKICKMRDELGPYGLNDDEIEYIKKCEAISIDKMKAA